MEERVAPVISTVAESLGALGYSPTDSLVLAYFLLNSEKEITSREVERETWLRQPQVSLSINSLIDKKWIVQTSVTTIPNGRPVLNYSLKMKPDVICDRIRDAILNDMDLKMRSVNKLDVILHASRDEAIPCEV